MTIVLTRFTGKTPRSQIAKFLKKLEHKGFERVQPSTYIQPELDQEDTGDLANDLEARLPRYAQVQVLFMTQEQWAQAYVLEGYVPEEDKNQLWIDTFLETPTIDKKDNLLLPIE